MLDKNIMLALNGADDIFLEETAYKLGYNTEIQERIVPMTDYRKRTSRRFISILIAACLLLSLGIAAYATEFFGIRTLLIKDDELSPTRGDEAGYVSITQPQEVPEEMSADVKAKIENSSKAWAEWDAWRKTNGIFLPEICIPPQGAGNSRWTENSDGSFTVSYYRGSVEDETQLIETRTISAEDMQRADEYWNARVKGYPGYDFNYEILNQEMAEKLEEIAKSYGLKLRHEATTMYENFADFTEFNSFEEVNAKVNEICAGGKSFFRTSPVKYEKFYYFDEGTFALSFYTTDDNSNEGTRCYIYNSPYGTLSSGYEITSQIENVNAMSAYTHIAPDGTELTVLHNGADMFAYVYLENSFVTMHFNQPDGLSTEEINSIIDMVNFSAIK